MTDTPDHIWAIDANGERLWETEDHGPHCTEYTRRALSDGRYAEMVVLLDKQRAEVARLKAALERIEKINRVAHNYISCYMCRETSMVARAALEYGEADQ